MHLVQREGPCRNFRQRSGSPSCQEVKKTDGTDITGNLRALSKLKDGNDFFETLTRARFEEINMAIKHKDAGVNKEDFDGFPSSLSKGYLGGKVPSKGIDADEAVAYAVAVQGGVLSGGVDTEDILL
ncbi:hypothetical protein HWV62_20874 [Athelia sp. TMB]|nr:hypothetical protein HWV62_20874 [Athelia sp. TMB]